MYWLDTAILVLLVAGAGLGAWTGLLKQIVRVVGLITALAAAVFLHDWASNTLQQSVLQGSNPMVADGLAYVAVFLAVLLAFQVTAMLIDRLLKAIKLKWADRVLGFFVGGLKAALILGAISLAMIVFPPNQATKEAMEQSRIAPVLAAGVKLTLEAVPVQYTQALREGYDKVMEEAAKKVKELHDKEPSAAPLLPSPPANPSVPSALSGQ